MSLEELNKAIEEGEELLKKYPNNPLVLLELIQLRARLLEMLR